MNRTQEEIVERLRGEKTRDPFGFADTDLLVWLDYDHAKEFLQTSVTKEKWEAARIEAVRKLPKEAMIDYMPFAWDKAINCRGLSACRSMNHFANWLWLDGQDELAESLYDYQHYGKDNLVKVCRYLGLDPAKWDDGIRVNSESEL